MLKKTIKNHRKLTHPVKCHESIGIARVGRILAWAAAFVGVFFAGTFLANEPHLFESRLQVEVDTPDSIVKLERDIVVVPGSIIIDPQYPKIGQPISVAVKLKNEGNLAVRGTFDVRFSINGHVVKKVIVNELNPGQMQIIYVDLELDKGFMQGRTIELTVSADSENKVIENEKQNNISATVFSAS